MTASDSSDDRVLFAIDSGKKRNCHNKRLNNPKQRNSY